MKTLLTIIVLATMLFAGIDEDYYTGLAKNTCEQAVRRNTDEVANHEYWFGTYESPFFTDSNLAYHVAIFSGDNLKIKNRLGIFQQYRYTCIYRTDMREVIMIQTGRITLGRTRQTDLYRSPIRRRDHDPRNRHSHSR